MVAFCDFDSVRTLAAGSLSGSYTAVGSPIANRARGICFTNTTDGAVYFTNDTAKDKIVVPAGSFKLWDCQANMNTGLDKGFSLKKNEQWYCKEIDGSSTGSVYIENLIGYDQ